MNTLFGDKRALYYIYQHFPHPAHDGPPQPGSEHPVAYKMWSDTQEVENYEWFLTDLIEDEVLDFGRFAKR
jgi:hypothetical protein